MQFLIQATDSEIQPFVSSSGVVVGPGSLIATRCLSIPVTVGPIQETQGNTVAKLILPSALRHAGWYSQPKMRAFVLSERVFSTSLRSVG